MHLYMDIQSINDKRCWTEIDLQQLRKNLEIYRQSIPSLFQIMAVVKADAYGHGDIEVSKVLSCEGIQSFAVSNVDEAIHIREQGIKGQILILGYTPLDRAADLIKYDITQTLISSDYADEIESKDLPIKCQFAIDTGMRRIGLNADDPDQCERTIRNHKQILDGIFSHLCVADTEEQDDFTNDQIVKFEEVARRVNDLELKYIHLMNSAGGLWHRSDICNHIRLGIVLYGLKPDYTNVLPEGIEPVLSWKSVVSMVKDVKPGETIGYGRTYVAKQPISVATIPVGYADGYSRLLSNKGWVLINGERAPIVGRVCMDQMMVDVSGISSVNRGTEVVLIGRSGTQRITADELARLYGTIGYEVVCGISKRVERTYIY